MRTFVEEPEASPWCEKQKHPHGGREIASIEYP